MDPLTISPVEIEITLKVLAAAVLGLMIGVERKGGPQGAGMRTFSLICMGSALFTVMSVWGFPGNDKVDPSRIAAQIITGMGFIGAGVIWRQREEAVHGITTAAAIWVSAAVGIAVALGFWLISIVTTLVTMLILARGHVIREAKASIQTELKGK
jgi:putative Mg2+ transporter-C (MgtC) family protein